MDDTTTAVQRARRFQAQFDRIMYRGPRRRRAMRILSQEYRDTCLTHLVTAFELVAEDSEKAIDLLGWPVIECGLLLFAEWKVKEGCEAVFRLLSIPKNSFSETLGLVFSHLGPRVVASIFAPAPTMLLTLIRDSNASDAARAVSLRAIPTLVARGEIPREATIPGIQKLFFDQTILESPVMLEALFLSCIELHPADFIVNLLTIANGSFPAPADGEDAVKLAWERPADSIRLINNRDLAPISSAANWFEPDQPSNRLRSLLAYLEVPNPDWEFAFRAAVRSREAMLVQIRALLNEACENSDCFARDSSPYPLLCAICLAAEFKDLDCGLHLLRILSEGSQIIDQLMGPDVLTVVPHALVAIFASKPEHLCRLAADSRAHIKGRKAAVLALSWLVRSGIVGETEGLRLFEVVLELGLSLPRPHRGLWALLVSECGRIPGASESAAYTQSFIKFQNDEVNPLIKVSPQLAPEEITAASLMRLSRIYCGSPGQSPRFKKLTELMNLRAKHSKCHSSTSTAGELRVREEELVAS